jgi:hypothetical protein
MCIMVGFICVPPAMVAVWCSLHCIGAAAGWPMADVHLIRSPEKCSAFFAGGRPGSGVMKGRDGICPGPQHQGHQNGSPNTSQPQQGEGRGKNTSTCPGRHRPLLCHC